MTSIGLILGIHSTAEGTIFGTHPNPNPSIMRVLSALLIGILPTLTAFAQYNQKGMVHLAIGGAIGGHGTVLDQRFTIFGLTISNTETDAAATTTVPIELGFALGNKFTLGALIEPGRYVPDTANSDQNNSLAVVAIQPRFYLVNKDRFAWTASAQLGAAALHIQDDTPGEKVDERYSGPAFGLGSGVAFGLGDHVGLEFHVRYFATNLELRAREFNDHSTMDFYKATLHTGGVVAQLSLAFRFGGS